MKIAIIGAGYVGLVAAACFAELDHDVVCIDRDEHRIRKLKSGIVPVYERFLPELLQKHRDQGLRFSSQLGNGVSECPLIFIAVGTPEAENGEADLSSVEAVARELSRCVRGYNVIVEKSTVPVCTSERIRQVLLLNGVDPQSFDVASNPEFLREGTAVTDFLYPDRIVIGTDEPRAANLLQSAYVPLLNGTYYSRPDAIPAPEDPPIPLRLIQTSAKSAELIKHASNAFLTTKISFINAIARICESVGANVEEVCDGIGSDTRIGSKFLKPGIGYGGSCFPKDLTAFRAVARECGYDFRLLAEVMRINEQQRNHFIRKIRDELWVVRGKRLGVLGLSFKGGTDDLRESPSLAIVKTLLNDGAEIVAYDPAAMYRAQEEMARYPEINARLRFAKDPYEAATGADALLFLTDWDEFSELDLTRLRDALSLPIIIDGRNLFDPEKMAHLGFRYLSVGRKSVAPAKYAERSRPPVLKVS